MFYKNHLFIIKSRMLHLSIIHFVCLINDITSESTIYHSAIF